MDEKGWIYRYVYLADKSGTIYEAMLNIVNGRSRRIIYAINNICAIDKVKGIDHGVVRSTENGRGSHIKVDSLENWVAHSETDVKQDFSIEDDAEQLHREYYPLWNPAIWKRRSEWSMRLQGVPDIPFMRITGQQTVKKRALGMRKDGNGIQNIVKS